MFKTLGNPSVLENTNLYPINPPQDYLNAAIEKLEMLYMGHGLALVGDEVFLFAPILKILMKSKPVSFFASVLLENMLSQI